LENEGAVLYATNPSGTARYARWIGEATLAVIADVGIESEEDLEAEIYVTASKT
jgi:hypothetical protein